MQMTAVPELALLPRHPDQQIGFRSWPRPHLVIPRAPAIQQPGSARLSPAPIPWLGYIAQIAVAQRRIEYDPPELLLVSHNATPVALLLAQHSLGHIPSPVPWPDQSH